MVHRQRCDGTRRGRLDHIRRIPPAAEPDLEHAQIGRHRRKQVERRGSDDLKHRDGRAVIDTLDMLQRIRQRLVGHQLPGYPKPLVEPHQVGRGEDVHALASRLRHGTQHGARAALAVRPAHVQHGWQPPLGMAHISQQPLQPVQPQVDQPRMQPVQAVDQRVDAALVAHAGIGVASSPSTRASVSRS